MKLSNRYDDRSITELLKESQSFESLEELVLSDDQFDIAEDLFIAVLRYTNLKAFSFTSTDDINDDLLNVLCHLTELRVLSVGGFLDVTTDGLVNLIRHLPQLEQLSLHCDYYSEYVQLKESTYLRIYEIFHARNKKLVIFNFDTSREALKEVRRKELFAEASQREVVRFITLDNTYFDGCAIVEI